MNHRRPWWIALSLLPPLIALCALIIPSGCGGGGSSSTSSPAPTTGTVAVALVGVPPPGNFRSVLLNISGIRINQKASANPNDSGWVTIPLPPAAGGGNGGQTPGDLQIDMLQSQSMAVVYNVSGAPPGDYQSLQVLVDPSLPGTIVPACSSGASNTEGCVNYPISIGGASVLTDIALTVSKDTTAPLVIQLQLSIATSPINTGDFYVGTVTATNASVNAFLAQVNGVLKLTGSGTGSLLLPLTVSAELTGTGTVIENVPVRNDGTKQKAYTLELPAVPAGTTYDIFVGGGGFTYAALKGITVTPQQFIQAPDLDISGGNTASLSGTINDNCTSLGLPGAQLLLLAPAANVAQLPSPRPTPPATDAFCLTNPSQCVVVATGFADQSGTYPLPGTHRNSAPFGQVPINQPDLALQISASGYTTLSSSAFVKANTQICSAATSATQCNFSLTTGYINGTVNLMMSPPPGNSVVVQVFAEDRGTNQLVSALTTPLTFKNTETSQPFVLNVPLDSSSFDLFAVAIDPFQGAAAPFPGHDIPVLANQPAPSQPLPGSTCLQSNAAPFAAMDCVGHGSISGTVQNPDAGTFVEVEKADPNNSLLVQILGTAPGLLSSSSPGTTAYTLCVPPNAGTDMYALQRFEIPQATPTPTSSPSMAAPSSTPTAFPVGPGQSITVPVPASTSSPCPSTCSNSKDTTSPCPGICNATNASPL